MCSMNWLRRIKLVVCWKYHLCHQSFPWFQFLLSTQTRALTRGLLNIHEVCTWRAGSILYEFLRAVTLGIAIYTKLVLSAHNSTLLLFSFILWATHISLYRSYINNSIILEFFCSTVVNSASFFFHSLGNIYFSI